MADGFVPKAVGAISPGKEGPFGGLKPDLFDAIDSRLLSDKFRPVTRLRSIVCLLLIAVWLPASSHTLLEFAGVIHERHANHDADSSGSHEHDTANHEAADGKCAVSSTQINIPVRDMLALPLLFCARALSDAAELHSEPEASGLAPPGVAPPQLSHRWQFSFRTALPARAPSLIS